MSEHFHAMLQMLNLSQMSAKIFFHLQKSGSATADSATFYNLMSNKFAYHTL